MKVVVRAGDVLVVRVEVGRHPANIHTVRISTPLEAHPAVRFGSQSIQGGGLFHFIDVWPASGYAMPMGIAEPTRVELTGETPAELEALASGLCELDRWARWSVLLVAMPFQVVGRVREVALWEAPNSAGVVDYLEREVLLRDGK